MPKAPTAASSMRVRIGGSVARLRINPWIICVIVAFTVLLFFIIPNRSAIHRNIDDEYLSHIVENPHNELDRKRLADAAPRLDDDAAFGEDLNRPFVVHPPKSVLVMAMQAGVKKNDNRVKIVKLQRRFLSNQTRPEDKIYNINVTRSDSISLDRSIVDTRPAVCRKIKYDRDDLPRATVVIPFYNEALSMLLRTVHSVLNRTPDKLLTEVILVDDHSTYEYLQGPLESYLHNLPKVRLIRNSKREGLIVSRIRGNKLATSKVVIFLDAHTECNTGWLEPLLSELKEHPDSVIQPFVDGIDANSIEYTSPPTLYKGSFSWDLRYTWLRVSDHESARAMETGYPYFSPTLVGCAIAVRRLYFQRIGQFDTGMRVWGGENIELGFRTWMCGGRVVTVICSRVGHVFKDFPYKFDGNREMIVQKNLMRVSDVWMDGASKYFYAATRTYEFKRVEFTDSELATLKERKKLRERLHCKNFDWYLQNIIPEVTPPPMDVVYYGEIMNLKTRACFEALQDYYVGVTYLCFEHKIIPRNNFELTIFGQLRMRDRCVHIEDGMPTLRMRECEQTSPSHPLNSVWSLENRGHVWGRLKVTTRQKDGTSRVWCVMHVTNVMTPHAHEQMPQLATCDDKNDFQLWTFTYKFSFDQVPKHIMQS